MAIAVIVVASYVAAQILSDITSLRIVMLAGLSMDAGTLIYPITFTLRDLVHKTLGAAAARILIVTAAVINVAMALLFALVSSLRPDLSVGPQEEFAAVLSPVWRIVIASIIAEVVSELIDTEVYRLWVDRFGASRQWMRVLLSNGVSVPIDSLLFCGIAFVGTMPLGTVASIFVANVVVKVAVTLFSVPTIYLVRERSSD